MEEKGTTTVKVDLAAKVNTVREREITMEERESTMEERESTMEERENTMEERENTMEERESTMEEREKAVIDVDLGAATGKKNSRRKLSRVSGISSRS